MTLDPLDLQKMTPTKHWCHRTQPMLIPRELQRIDLVRLACIQEQCTLWDPQDKQCLDITVADTLAVIASHIRIILDHLPPTLP